MLANVRPVLLATNVLERDDFLTFSDDVDPLTALADDVTQTNGLIRWLTRSIEAKGQAAVFEVEVLDDGVPVRVEGTSHLWKALYAEREHLTRAVRALSACRAEMPLAQRVGSLAGQIVEAALCALDLTPEQRAVAEAAALDAYEKYSTHVGAD